MGLVLVTTFGLSVWIVLWSLGHRSIDPFMITLIVVLLGAAGRSLAQYLPGRE